MPLSNAVIQQRMKISARWVEYAHDVAMQTKDKEATELVQFLVDHAALAVPQGYKKVTVYRRGLAPNSVKCLFMPIIREDMKKRGSIVAGWENSHLAHVLEERRTIIVRDDVAMTRAWRGLVLLHEARHAKELAEEPYDITNPYEFSARERDVFIMEIRLARLLGGQQYTELVEQVKAPELYPRLNPGEHVPWPDKYDSRLDEVFGRACSVRERGVRQVVFWLDAAFNVMDSKYPDPNGSKLHAIRKLYGKRIPMRRTLIEACQEVLPPEVGEGLEYLDLDDDDFRMAVFAELADHGVGDPTAFLKARGILEESD